MTDHPSANSGQRAAVESAKRQLRVYLRDSRKCLSAARQQHAATAAAQYLTELPEWHRYRAIACYLDADGELPTDAIIDLCERQGKTIYLPALCRHGMEFRRYHSARKLERGRYGLLQPAADCEAIAAAQLDLVLMPVVGFDANGGRLGMGGGYYDRCFADRSGSGPLLVGLAHTLQEVAEIPLLQHDARLDGVITEQGFISVGKGSAPGE